MSTEIYLRSVAHATKRLTHVEIPADGTVRYRWTDGDGNTQTALLDLTNLTDGHHMQFDDPVLLGHHQNGTYRARLEMYDADGTGTNEGWVGPYTSFPVYPLWPDDETEAALTTTSVVAPTAAEIAAPLKLHCTELAKIFEAQFNHLWGRMAARDRIEDDIDSSDTHEVAAQQRTDATEDWARAWVGFLTLATWTYANGGDCAVPGMMEAGDDMFTLAKLKDIHADATTELQAIGVETWYIAHNPAIWTAYHNARQLWSTDASTGGGDERIWTASTAAWWKNVKARWGYVARWGQWPALGTLTLGSSTATVGTAVTATLSDPGGTTMSQEHTWQTMTPPGGADNVDVIDGATSASYTPVAADVGNKVRRVTWYHNADGIYVGAWSAWTDAVAE